MQVRYLWKEIKKEGGMGKKSLGPSVRLWGKSQPGSEDPQSKDCLSAVSAWGWDDPISVSLFFFVESFLIIGWGHLWERVAQWWMLLWIRRNGSWRMFTNYPPGSRFPWRERWPVHLRGHHSVILEESHNLSEPHLQNGVDVISIIRFQEDYIWWHK